MPLLSEAGTDRNLALKFAKEFESVGAKQLAPIKGVNRNIKLNLVSEAFMRKGDFTLDLNDPNWHIKYEDPSSTGEVTFTKRILDLLQIVETREVFGLTYKDLLDMDVDTFNYVSDTVVKLAKERIEQQKREELRSKENGTKQ